MLQPDDIDLPRGAALEEEGIPEREDQPPGSDPEGLGSGRPGYLDED